MELQHETPQSPEKSAWSTPTLSQLVAALDTAASTGSAGDGGTGSWTAA